MKLFCIVFLLLGTAVLAAVNPSPNDKLDMSGIQVNFREGELDAVKALLESFLKQQGPTATRDEKIFAYKYLGVIYAADSTNRAKAESYFNLLLPLAPNIELADMYISNSIQAVFDDVKRKYLHTQEYRSNFDPFGNPKNPSNKTVLGTAPTSEPQAAVVSEPSKNHNWIWWTAGGAATVAVGTGIVLMMSQETSSSSQHFDGAFK